MPLEAAGRAYSCGPNESGDRRRRELGLERPPPPLAGPQEWTARDHFPESVSRFLSVGNFNWHQGGGIIVVDQNTAYFF